MANSTSNQEIGNWKLNREKLKLEIEKLRRESNLLSYDEKRARIEMERKLQERECLMIFNSLLRRLERNSIKLKDIDLTLEEFNDQNSR